MSKKDFIALADAIVTHNQAVDDMTMKYGSSADTKFTQDQLETLAQFCRNDNYRFMTDRWFSYIKGECGPNGGRVK